MEQHSPAIARWEEMAVLLGITWDTREQCIEQGEWMKTLGWRVIPFDLVVRKGKPPEDENGLLLYAVVLHPDRDASPGALRYRRPTVRFPTHFVDQELSLVP